MNWKIISNEQLISYLSNGWNSVHQGPLPEFFCRMQEKLNIQLTDESIYENFSIFKTEMNSIRLRGMDSITCLLLAGHQMDTDQLAKLFWDDIYQPGHIPFIMTLNPGLHFMANNVLPREKCLVLSPSQIIEIFDSSTSSYNIKCLIRQQIHPHSLIPYNIVHPSVGPMFFGRRFELDRLFYEEDISFAIAGPSRIGKTSLVKQYRREVKHKGESRMHYMPYIDFYGCEDKSADGIARFIAKHIESSSRSARMTANELINFLRYHKNRQNCRLELIMDETDEVISNEAFNYLGQAVKEGYCRIILCGRGQLLKFILSEESPLACRIDLLKLEPLDEKAAKSLLLEPLIDLGIKIEQSDKLVSRVFEITGRLPHLMQFFGDKLANLAIASKINTLVAEQIDTILWDYDTAQYFVRPLYELDDAAARFVAFNLIKHETVEVTIPLLTEMMVREGINISQKRLLEICYDLVINHILLWNNGNFSITNRGLVHFAHELDLLDSGIREAAKQLQVNSICVN